MEEKSVLIMDNEKRMVRDLTDTLDSFNKRAASLKLPSTIKPIPDWHFRYEPLHTAQQISDRLRSNPIFDSIIIDRKFPEGYDNFNRDILLPLQDLQNNSVKIVWTAFPGEDNGNDNKRYENKNLIECMRLGAWDYLDKNNPRYGHTFIDVVVSIIEGLKQREIRMRKTQIDQEAHRFVVENYQQIFDQHKGNYLAFEEQNGTWLLVEENLSILGLYLKLEKSNKDRNKLHITLIPE